MSKAFRITFLLVLLTSFTHFAWAQKFGYVNTDFILSKMPEYQEAQNEINTLSLQWQEEIQNKHKEIEAKYSELQAEEVLLTEEMKQERTAAIKQMENTLKEYQKKVFGYEGLFFLKKKELIKPVQDQVFEAVQKVCKENRLAIMFDKSGELVMIYTDPVHDYTDYVLDELGLGNKEDVIR
jgi:outer membrane protein